MRRVLPYLITFLVGAAIVVLVICLQKVWAQTTVQNVMTVLCNGFFISGVIVTGAGIIVFASNGGAFYMLGYAMRLLVDLFKRHKEDKKYKDYYDYQQQKQQKKHSFAFMLIVGIGFLLISAVFLILYYKL